MEIKLCFVWLICFAHKLLAVNLAKSGHLELPTPYNTIIMFVPQQEAWIVERMGKYHRILEPGLNFLIPFIDTVKYVRSLKEIAIDIPEQTAITKDNVALSLDGILYLRIVDPYRSSYGVENPLFAITQIAQTTMRSEIGKIPLDSVFHERESLNVHIVHAINKASEAWGMTCLRYEIRDIKLPERIEAAMQMEVEAERTKRAKVLESEGLRAATINVAEGKKQSSILASEAEKERQINMAHAESVALLKSSEARAQSIKLVAEGEKQSSILASQAEKERKINLADGDYVAQLKASEARAQSLQLLAAQLLAENGHNAGSLILAEQYVKAFGQMGKQSNTLILPADVSNVPGMVAQAMSVYKQISNSKPNR